MNEPPLLRRQDCRLGPNGLHLRTNIWGEPTDLSNVYVVWPQRNELHSVTDRKLVLAKRGRSQTGEIFLTVALQGDGGGSSLCTHNQSKGKMLCSVILVPLASGKRCKL